MNLVTLFFAIPLVALTLLGLLVYGIVVVAREARERYRAGRTDRRVATQWAEAAAAGRLGQWEARAVGSRLGHKQARKAMPPPVMRKTVTLPNEIRKALSRLHPCPHLERYERDWREKAGEKFPGRAVEPLWQKEDGRVPRGFSGASDGAEKVEAVFVIAEPSPPKGQPLGDVPNQALLETICQLSMENLRSGREDHHVKLRDGVLRRFFPGASFNELMRRCFMTCSVYCSNPMPFDASARPPRAVEERCGELHLIEVLRQFPHAEVIALGGKAHTRLAHVGKLPDAPENLRDHVVAAHPKARPKDHPEESWDKAVLEFARRQERPSARARAPRQLATEKQPRRQAATPAEPTPVQPPVAPDRESSDGGAWPWLYKTFSIAPGVTFDRVRGFRCPSACVKTRAGVWEADGDEARRRIRPRPPYQKILGVIKDLGGTASGFEIFERLKDEPRRSEERAEKYWSDYLRAGTTQYGPYFVAR